MRIRWITAVAMATTIVAQPALADWPDRSLRFILPFQAGGTSDIVARLVAEELHKRLGQPVVIENRVGGSGSIGADAVAKSPPDGYTIGFATLSTHAISATLAPNLPYDPAKDFAPVATLGTSPYALAVTKDLPANTVAELIALAKAKPRELNYSSIGPASLGFLAGQLFATMAGVELTTVSYRGSAQALLDLKTGRIQMQFGTAGTSLQAIRDGSLRALAQTGSKRLAVLSDIPTLDEAGLKGYEASLWMAVMAPANTPPAIVARLNREINAALAEPEIKRQIEAQAVVVEPTTPEQLGERIRRDIEKWRKIAITAKLVKE